MYWNMLCASDTFPVNDKFTLWEVKVNHRSQVGKHQKEGKTFNRLAEHSTQSDQRVVVLLLCLLPIYADRT